MSLHYLFSVSCLIFVLLLETLDRTAKWSLLFFHCLLGLRCLYSQRKFTWFASLFAYLPAKLTERIFDEGTQFIELMLYCFCSVRRIVWYASFSSTKNTKHLREGKEHFMWVSFLYSLDSQFILSLFKLLIVFLLLCYLLSTIDLLITIFKHHQLNGDMDGLDRIRSLKPETSDMISTAKSSRVDASVPKSHVQVIPLDDRLRQLEQSDDNIVRCGDRTITVQRISETSINSDQLLSLGLN